MAEKDADVQKIQELIKIMRDNDLVKIDIKHGDDRISLRRAGPPKAAAMAGPILTSSPGAPLGVGNAQPTSEPVRDDLLEIKSPIVGTFYEAPSPDSDPYVEIGDHVNAQSVVCIIEAMKVMNEIKAEISGTIVERRIANGQAVEYGQVLFKVKPE